MLAGMLFAGGCVSQEKYNELLTMNRKAIDARKAAEHDLEAAKVANHGLQGELDARDRIIAGKNTGIALLEGQNEDLLAQVALLTKKLSTGGDGGIGDINILPGTVNKALAELARANSDLFDYYPKYGMVKIKSDMTFGKGSADVKPDAVVALKKLAEIMNTEAAKPFNIYIAGHTDDMPIKRAATLRDHKSNWHLSSHRAIGVAKILFTANVDSTRMGVLGFSKYHPVEPNAAGNKGNEANRRVEIWLVPPNRFLTDAKVDAAK